eukprot:GSA120T00019624001.1
MQVGGQEEERGPGPHLGQQAPPAVVPPPPYPGNHNIMHYPYPGQLPLPIPPPPAPAAHDQEGQGAAAGFVGYNPAVPAAGTWGGPPGPGTRQEQPQWPIVSPQGSPQTMTTAGPGVQVPLQPAAPAPGIMQHGINWQQVASRPDPSLMGPTYDYPGGVVSFPSAFAGSFAGPSTMSSSPASMGAAEFGGAGGHFGGGFGPGLGQPQQQLNYIAGEKMPPQLQPGVVPPHTPPQVFFPPSPQMMSTSDYFLMQQLQQRGQGGCNITTTSSAPGGGSSSSSSHLSRPVGGGRGSPDGGAAQATSDGVGAAHEGGPGDVLWRGAKGDARKKGKGGKAASSSRTREKLNKETKSVVDPDTAAPQQEQGHARVEPGTVSR